MNGNAYPGTLRYGPFGRVHGTSWKDLGQACSCVPKMMANYQFIQENGGLRSENALLGFAIFFEYTQFLMWYQNLAENEKEHRDHRQNG